MKNLNKKIRFCSNFKTKSFTILLVTFLLSVLFGTQLIGEASAVIDYTEYTGTLNGADWALRIPKPWNGMLVVYCRGSTGQVLPDPSGALGFCNIMLEQGFAVAASNYGAVGRCYSAAVDSTYELTMYVIDNFDVTGKIFLHGVSLGGTPALLLGEKYPDVYSGVLEMMGAKDMKFSYTLKSRWANLSDAELEAEMTALGMTTIPPPIYSTLDEFRSRCANQTRGLIRETGGTPATHQQVYEDISPTYHADIQIPVITVHGTDDAIVPYYHSILYQDAVARAGKSSLYRLYTVIDGGHNGGVLDEKPARFNELVEWSNELTGAHDWPMYRNNVQHSGYSTSNGPTTNQTLWIADLGVVMQSSPAVVDGKLYVGAGGGNVYCLDAADGSIIWNTTTIGDDFIFSSPAVVNGKVYIGGYDDVFYCLDAATGAKIWSYTTGGDILPSAAVANGKVYVGSDDGKLYCFGADYGQVVWKFTAGGAVQSSPAVVDGKVYVGSADNKFYCIDANSGALVWSYTTGDEIPATAAVVDGRVFIGSTDDTVYCLDAATGAKLWSFATGGDAHNPAVVDGKVYVGSSDDNLYCLDAETGAKIWSYTTASTGFMFYGAPAIANGVVYVACYDGNVYAFSAWEPIPEGLTIGVMLILSTIAVIVSARYFRKRREWENW